MPNPWPTPRAWLFGWVDTDSPGYRKIDVSGGVATVAAGYYRWPAYITALDTALGAEAWAAISDAFGRVYLAGTSDTLTWTDRAGWLCGMFAEPTQTTPSAVTNITSIMPPPASIPLIGATWDEVAVDSERAVSYDRNAQGWGYTFGSARVWRWTLTMHRTSAESFRQGWMRSGKVTLSSYAPADFGLSSAWTVSNTDGHLDAHVVRVESMTPLDTGINDFWEVVMLVTEAGP